ncbi:MAG: tyrosine-type recombinase/integrase [Alphaproteobacteria bacterium]|nr:tyrosine-type recombinase/integrase [Alphaproteobacteria bacterium]
MTEPRNTLPAATADGAALALDQATRDRLEAAFLAARAEGGATMATLRIATASIGKAHELAGEANPCPDRIVKTAMQGLARQARALDAEAVAAIRGALNGQADRLPAALTVAICSVMAESGLRRSEAAALRWCDLEPAGNGSARLTVHRSKTDQLGDGAVVALTSQAVADLDRLASLTGTGWGTDAPVFGLSDRQIARRIAAAARRAGLGDGFSGHSGRVGTAQRMTRNGAPAAAVMRQGRWSTVRMVARYTRHEAAGEALKYLQRRCTVKTIRQKIRQLVPFALALTVLATLPAAAQTVDEALTAFKRGDYATALRGFRTLAEQGDAIAQLGLGGMYSVGKGVPQDDVEAVRWYRRAAEQGDATAQYALGYMYDKGKGVPRDFAEAARWWRLSAEQGFAFAQFELGAMYQKGKGMPVTRDPAKKYAEVVRWWRLSAEQGHTSAQFELARLYEFGYGVPQDGAEAVRWYRRAAKQGHARAQFRLALMYDRGNGVPKDAAEAAHWYGRAAEQGR